MDTKMMNRLQVKTPQQRFVYLLENEFHFAPKIARAILEEAQACLYNNASTLHPGQIRVILTRLEAKPGRPLKDTDLIEVTWTIDAGAEDREVLQKYGPKHLRQVRILRLLSEAVEQGSVGTQEDLAEKLHVTLRTIKRDFAELQAKGYYLPTRGNLHGVGRGQTHKAQIIAKWLQGKTYDQISSDTYHTTSAIKRYIQTFVRVIELHLQDFSNTHIAQLLQIGQPLVCEYLAVYEQNHSSDARQRLQEQLHRFRKADHSPKKRSRR